jgi:hypothetical protein
VSRLLPEIRLRPVTEADLGMFRHFVVEPGLIGLDWAGFRDPKAIQRRFFTDSYLGDDDGRLIVDVTAGTAEQRSLERPGSPPRGLDPPRPNTAGHQLCRQGHDLLFSVKTGIDSLSDRIAAGLRDAEL